MVKAITLKVTDPAGRELARKEILFSPPYLMDEALHQIHMQMCELMKDAIYHAFGPEEFAKAEHRFLENIDKEAAPS